jgi:hypothetical protein
MSPLPDAGNLRPMHDVLSVSPWATVAGSFREFCGKAMVAAGRSFTVFEWAAAEACGAARLTCGSMPPSYMSQGKSPEIALGDGEIIRGSE